MCLVTPPNKSARNRGNVKCVKYVQCFGRNWAKHAQTFNIFNISPVLSILDQKHITFPLFRFLAEFPPKHLTHLTYLTFPLFSSTFFFTGPPDTFKIFNISPVLNVFLIFLLYFPCFVDLGSRNRGNVKCFFPKMLKTGEMLNMLNVWLFLTEFPPKHLTHSTYLTFPLFRALFSGAHQTHFTYLTYPLF